MLRGACLLLGLLGLGCSSGSSCREDAGVAPDASLADAEPTDADAPDAEPTDADAPDADASAPDASASGAAPELFRFLAEQQGQSGLLESFVSHAGLPPDFRGYLASARPVFVYDVSLAILAWLGRGEPDDLRRARRALEALVAALGPDGRVPDVIHAETLAPSSSSSTGNATWVMLALLTAWEQLGDEAWRVAAERIGAFLLDPQNDLLEPAGFGGVRLRPGSRVRSTEHNLDAYPAFTRLASALPTSAGRLEPAQARAAATHARIFAESQFDPARGAVWAGSGDALLTINEAVTPLDTQSWAVLSLGREKWRASYAWARQPPPAGLWVSSTRCGAAPVQGPPFSTADLGDVWLEGLGQMQAAANQLGLTAQAADMAGAIELVRLSAPNTDARGLVATCSEIQTGFGSSYFNTLHVGATAWAAIAAVEVNPYWGTSTQGGLPNHPAASLPWVRVEVPTNARFACESYGPCPFVVRGTSAGLVAGAYTLAAWVRPLTAPGLPYFLQREPVALDASGDFEARAQIGGAEAGGVPGERLEVVVTIVEASASLPSSTPSLNPAAISGLVGVSGRLTAQVE